MLKHAQEKCLNKGRRWWLGVLETSVAAGGSMDTQGVLDPAGSGPVGMRRRG